MVGAIEYHEAMPERVTVRVRRLPDGGFQEACRISSQGRFWELELDGEALALGSLLEIERESILYWGALQEIDGSKATVSIEHSLDTSRLQPIREIWGE